MAIFERVGADGRALRVADVVESQRRGGAQQLVEPAQPLRDAADGGATPVTLQKTYIGGLIQSQADIHALRSPAFSSRILIPTTSSQAPETMSVSATTIATAAIYSPAV